MFFARGWGPAADKGDKMITCQCGQDFTSMDEWREHYAKLRPPYPSYIQVERGQLTTSQFRQMRRTHDQFVEDHKIAGEGKDAVSVGQI